MRVRAMSSSDRVSLRGFLRGAVVSPPISETFASNAREAEITAFSVGDLAITVAEIEFGQVAL